MKQGVSAAIWWQNQCLLIKRGHAPYKDYWTLPGGRVENNESLQDAIMREINEEVGLCLTDFIQITEHDLSSEGFDFQLTIFKAILVQKKRPEIMISSDAVDHTWISYDYHQERFSELPKPLTHNLINYLKQTMIKSD